MDYKSVWTKRRLHAMAICWWVVCGCCTLIAGGNGQQEIADDVREMCEVLDAAAKSWLDRVQVQCQYRYYQTTMTEFGKRWEIDFPENDNVNVGSFAQGDLVKTQLGYKSRFTIVGKTDFDPETRMGTWNSSSQGYYRNIGFMFEPLEKSNRSESISSGGSASFYFIQGGIEDITDPCQTTIEFCGAPGRTIVQLENQPGKDNFSLLSARMLMPDEEHLEIETNERYRVSTGSLIDRTTIYRFWTVPNEPLLQSVKRESRQDGELVSQSMSIADSFVELENNLHIPTRLFTSFGPVVSTTSSEPLYVARTWEASDVSNTISANAFELEFPKGTKILGLKQSSNLVNLETLSPSDLSTDIENTDVQNTDSDSDSDSDSERQQSEALVPQRRWNVLGVAIVVMVLLSAISLALLAIRRQ